MSEGYLHKKVFHGASEYAPDEDKDRFHEIHCNTVEGVWALLKSWLRTYRGGLVKKNCLFTLDFLSGYITLQ
ncbi:MAG: hypothetical protein OHK0038_10140 [Flammeovirgaceae bacterium]